MKYLALYFHTSSDTKFAHIKYLLNQHGVKVKILRASWAYPELQDHARESLRAGAEYLRKKSRFALPFIIEDTEVQIEAYRGNSKISYPGFDVKRWWKVTTFSEIDAKCQQAGTRAVSQASNICLSLPGLEPIIYRGTIRGEIAYRPKTGPDDPKTPWLNSRDFGSIFVPHGAELPFGALPLEQSLKFDFRKGAVDKLAQKIQEINAILNLDPNCYRVEDEDISPSQLPLYEISNGEDSKC